MNHTSLKETGAVVLHHLGLYRVMRFLNRHNVAVLLYHSVVRDNEEVLPPWVVTESQFRWQMEYLEREYQVLPLPHFIECLRAGRPLPAHSLVITFDDGFRNNYTIAYPILKEIGMPATIFLVTGYIDSDEALWPDVLFQAVHRTKVEALDLTDWGQGTHSLGTVGDRQAIFLTLVESLKILPAAEKNQRLAEIARRLQLNLDQFPNREEAPFALLRRHEIQEMAQSELITFGVHTESHEILTRLPFEEAQQEIRISKQKLEALLGEPARFFAFPNGTEADINESLKRELERQGFACGFASRGGLVRSQFDLFQLARLGIGPELSHEYFQLKLSGGVDALKQIKNLLVRNGRS